MSAQQHNEYLARINRVIDHIDRHLGDELTLDELAGVANFSRYHFHRLFSALVGEPLNQFIVRLRLEKAATQLITHPDKPVTDVALDCGFSGSASFAKVFKNRFGMSASTWREQGEQLKSKNGQQDRNSEQKEGKPGKAEHDAAHYSRGNWSMEVDPETRTLRWRKAMKNMSDVNVEVKKLPEMPVAYVRHVGPYAGDSALFGSLFEKLGRWAGPRGLFANPDTRFLTVYHDDPSLTEESKLRISVCVTIPEEMAVDGEIGKMTLEGGDYAIGHFEIDASQYGEAWNHIMAGWLPQSGYQPDDRQCFEMNLNDPEKHPEGKHLVDICIPVKPL